MGVQLCDHALDGADEEAVSFDRIDVLVLDEGEDASELFEDGVRPLVARASAGVASEEDPADEGHRAQGEGTEKNA